VVKFETYVARRNPKNQEFPAFMQNVSNKMSLDVLHQKSLKEQNYTNSQYLGQ
jgi:hypothetical protein